MERAVSVKMNAGKPDYKRLEVSEGSNRTRTEKIWSSFVVMRSLVIVEKAILIKMKDGKPDCQRLRNEC